LARGQALKGRAAFCNRPPQRIVEWPDHEA
jgi:hypothetical protein